MVCVYRLNDGIGFDKPSPSLFLHKTVCSSMTLNLTHLTK